MWRRATARLSASLAQCYMLATPTVRVETVCVFLRVSRCCAGRLHVASVPAVPCDWLAELMVCGACAPLADQRFPVVQPDCASCASRWCVLSAYAGLNVLANYAVLARSTETPPLLLVLGSRGRAIAEAAQVHFPMLWGALRVRKFDTINPARIEHAVRSKDCVNARTALARAASAVHKYVNGRTGDSALRKRRKDVEKRLMWVLAVLVPAFDPDVLQRKTRDAIDLVRKRMEELADEIVRAVLRQLGRPYVPGAVLDTSEVIVQLLLLRELQRRVNDGKLVAAVEECQKLADAAAEAAERAGAKPSWLSKKKTRESELKEPRPRPGEERVAVQR